MYGMKKRKNTIVVVNSFKGGAGKTSIALSYCVTRTFQNKKKEKQNKKKVDEKVFFVDIDLLGTGSRYILLGEGAGEVKWLNSEDKTGIGSRLVLDQYVNVLKMSQEPVGEFELYGILSNPVIDSYFQEGSSYRKNRSVEEARYRNKVKSVLQEIMRDGSDNYIVLDCSPGVSRMEKELLNIVYQEARDNQEVEIEVQELYITTYDNGHFNKTIQNLKNEAQTLRISGKRNINVILNDIHNIAALRTLSDSQEWSEGGFNFQLKEKEAVEKIQEELENIDNLKVSTVEYNYSMAASSLYNNAEILVSHPDKYILNEKNFHEYGEQEYEENDM